MGRKKIENIETLLIHRIRTRVNEKTYKKLDNLRVTSNCKTIGQIARQILSKEPITVFHKDITVEGVIQELIRIRGELRAIGVNVNQIVHFFHTSETANQKMFHALKVAEEYSKVGEKVETLVSMVGEIGRKWLQR